MSIPAQAREPGRSGATLARGVRSGALALVVGVLSAACTATAPEARITSATPPRPSPGVARPAAIAAPGLRASTAGSAARPTSAADLTAAVLVVAIPPSLSGTARRTVVDLLDHACAEFADPARLGCRHPVPIAPTTLRRVAERLRPLSVRIVHAAPPGATSPPGGPARVLISTTPVQRRGATARLVVQVRCGFNCLSGDGLVLTRTHGSWRITGHYLGYIA